MNRIRELISKYKEGTGHYYKYADHCRHAACEPIGWSFKIPVIGVNNPEGRWTIEKLMREYNGPWTVDKPMHEYSESPIPANLFTGICLYDNDTVETVAKLPSLEDYYKLKVMADLKKHVRGDVIVCIPDWEYTYATNNMSWMSSGGKIPANAIRELADRVEKLARGLIPDVKILRTTTYNNDIVDLANKTSKRRIAYEPYYPDLQVSEAQRLRESDLHHRYAIETAMGALVAPQITNEPGLPLFAVLGPEEKSTVNGANKILNSLYPSQIDAKCSIYLTKMFETAEGKTTSAGIPLKEVLEGHWAKKSEKHKWRTTHGIWQVIIPHMPGLGNEACMYNESRQEHKILLNSSKDYKPLPLTWTEVVGSLLSPYLSDVMDKEIAFETIRHHITKARKILNG